MEFRYPSISGADLSLLEGLIQAVGSVRDPVLLDPPFDDEEVIWVAFSEDPPVQFSFENPSLGTKSKVFRLPMREVIG